MDDQVYTISQAAKEVGESTSVLRYWEDVLEIRVNRNTRGYRCYTGYDIQLFLNIKELKKRGLKLEAIRELIPRIYQYGPGSPRNKTRLLEDAGEGYMAADEEALEQDAQEQELPGQEIQETVVWDAGQAQTEAEIETEETGTEETAAEEITTEEITAEEIEMEAPLPSFQMHQAEDLRLTEFQNIMEKLIAQGMKEKNQEEFRLRKVDEKIRFHQQGMKQVAAAREGKQRRRKRGRRKRK